MDPEAISRALKQIKAAARAVVSLNAGLLAGARQLRGSIALLPPHRQFPHGAVNAFLAEIPTTFPLAESRLYISDQELVDADSRLATVEARHRMPVLLECKRIYFECSALQRSLGKQEMAREERAPKP